MTDAASWVFDGRPENIARLVEEVAASHRRSEVLAATFASAGEPEATALPGWTTAHLICHLERNAWSHIRMLEAALRDEVVDQYEGGDAGRAAEIDIGSMRPLGDLAAALADTDQRLEEVWRRFDSTTWRRLTSARAGIRPAFTCLWARWREVEIHSVDLGSPSSSWPASFARAGLDVAVHGLELRPLATRVPADTTIVLADSEGNAWTSDDGSTMTHRGVGTAQHLLAWVVGRGAAGEIHWTPEAPPLSPWP